MTKSYKILFLGAAAICLASTAAFANTSSSQYNSSKDWQPIAATAPQVQSTHAGNPHRDPGYALPTQARNVQPYQPNKMASTIQNTSAADEVSRPTTMAGDPHRDPANANSAYFNANADMSEHDTAQAKMRLSNREVRAIQEDLNDKGYKLAEDGIWGPQTAKAVRSFQANNNLTATGRLDTATIQALKASYQAPDAKVDSWGHPTR